ncbi:hypothetical protein C8A01DRAFT_21206 [Parachaetomium inaequale]|uniref:HNH nuclease domain-containing protein n=1 Tax=Parachaetomium inaequale TaxID=2588326 RepID=A0AAN6P4J4_9PEZI|nr:hypothetical protein C8A01DRAFT_21206 [Parachaetomium inaequale]
MAQQSPSSTHHMHQSSLESIIEFQTESPLSPGARDRARRRFYHIADHFEAAAEDRDSSSDNDGNIGGGGGGGGSSPRYNRSRLIRLTYDHARSPLSQDNFLRAFFGSLELSMDGEEALGERIRAKFFGFVDYLFNNFFLPLKAFARKAPQPSPAYHSAIQRLQGGVRFAGTPERISALRSTCLIRDRYRCVVTRRFDRSEAVTRFESAGDDARADDSNLLDEEQPRTFKPLEVAYILPHSLTRLGRSEELDPSKQAALAILNMFDYRVGHLIEGVDIDRPRNALTLTYNIHGLFSNFHIYFEPVLGVEPHTYRIESFLRLTFIGGLLPITRTLFLIDSYTIDLPSPRLLAIHRAITRILHLSAASAYIDKILRDIEDAGEQGARADGSTDLGRLVHLGLWLNVVDAYPC